MREGTRTAFVICLLMILLFGALSCLSSRKKESPIVAEKSSSAPSAAMSGCSICHVDVEIESKGSKHVAAGIGCSDCHGPSEGHIRDENNDVKPDRVFARADIDSFCNECHECSLPAKERPLPKVCTDCHDPHSGSVPNE